MKVRDLRVNEENGKNLAVLLRVVWKHVDGGHGLCLIILYMSIQRTEKKH